MPFIPLPGEEVIVFFQQLFSNKWNLVNHLNDECMELIKDAMKEVSTMADKRRSNVTLTLYVEMMEILLDESK